MPKEKADVSFLVGRQYVAKSGNVGNISLLERGAIQCKWVDRPTESDVEEFSTWACDLLNATVTTCIGTGNRDAALAKWREDMEK